MKKFLLLIFICFYFTTIDALYLKINSSTRSLESIDVRTYFLPTTPKENYCVWLRSDSSVNGFACEDEVDAQYSPSTSLYSIPDWFRSEHDFGDDGGILFEFHINDLATFVTAGFAAGIWEYPTECEEVWTRLSNNILKPVINKLSTFSHTEISIQEKGILFELHCKTKDDAIRQRYCREHNNFGCETSEIIGYHLCTIDTFLQILQANPQQENFKIL